MSGNRLRSLLPHWLHPRVPLPPTPSPPPNPRGEPEAILYRILTSDRPPLIPAGNTYNQLQFLLEHEPEHPGLAKRWLLNRLPDPSQREALVGLLEEHRQSWSEIPFDPPAYADCWSDIGNLPEHLHPWGHDFPQRPALEQAEVLAYLARNKNLYLLNRNGARNWALEIGLKDSPWVFAWDGACFLTSEAWQVIRPLLEVPDLAYLAVPMASVPQSAALLHGPDHPPYARLTPQLGFSRLARQHFHPKLREGALIDQELLRRLSLPGPWLNPNAPMGVCPWEAIDVTPAPDQAHLVQAGWTYRLPGALLPEADDPEDEEARLKALDSIRVHTRRADMAQIGTALSQKALRCWTALAGTTPAIPELDTIAANARAVPPPSVTDKPETLPGTAERSYVNAVPHWQTLAGSESTLNRSALLGLASPLCGDVAQCYDRARLQLMVDCVCALALDGHLNGNRDSHAHAHRLLHTWFLDPATAMIPDGAYARLSAVNPGHNVLDAAIDFRDLYPLLDAISLLQQAGQFSTAEQQQLEEWLDAFLGWLASDSAAFLRDHSASSACNWYHLLLLAIAAFRGKRNVAAQVFDNLPGLIARQFRPDGSPRSSASDARLRHDQLFNLQAWTNLVVISSTLGRDLLTFTDSNGHSLQKVFSHAQRFGPEDPAAAGERFTAKQWLETMEGCLRPASTPASGPKVPPLAEASSGLPPFWILCRIQAASAA
ncbi:MAG: alginate lyase family protein [Cyanobacteriota bacterium]